MKENIEPIDKFNSLLVEYMNTFNLLEGNVGNGPATLPCRLLDQHGIFTCPAQITDDFVFTLRHIYSRQLAGTEQACQLDGIPFIRLDLVTGFLRDQGWCHDYANIPFASQKTI